ncbi:MAG: DUF4492 domain-containing protein [Bacteroidales bacterium]|nr:DUF4492 domain-containing protein [Bacteroidales bacterium]
MFIVRLIRFYLEGFRNLSPLGRRLWLIILLKILILFGVFRIFFFRDFLGSGFDTDPERSDYVIERLTDGP